MSKIQFLKDKKQTWYEVSFIVGSPKDNLITIIGAPAHTGGFILEHDGKNYDCSTYVTIYRELENEVIYSNNEEKYQEPFYCVTFNSGTSGFLQGSMKQRVADFSDLKIPTIETCSTCHFKGWNPKIPVSGPVTQDIEFTATYDIKEDLTELKNDLIKEMNIAQQEAINAGCDITLAEDRVEHFTATEADQRSLAALQSLVMANVEQTPWHTSDTTEGCKFYSNKEMETIIQGVLNHVTYHVTYFRDLRRMILGASTREFLLNVFYGMEIKDEYKSEVLQKIEEGI